MLLTDILMSNWLTVFLALAAGLTSYIYVKWVHNPKGPVGLPYVGYYPFLSGSFHLDLYKLTKKYGEAFCFNVTGQTYVHLGSVRAVKEAHVTKFHCFAQRPQNFSLIYDAFGDGVGFVSGEQWKVLRKFFVQMLKEYGMGKETMDNLLRECLQKTTDVLRNTKGQNFDALVSFTFGSVEVIRGLLFSGTKMDDADFRGITDTYKDIMRCMEGRRQLLAGPLLKYVLLYLIPELREYRKSKFKMDSVYVKILREHEKSFDKGNIRNLIDCYINERKVLEEQGDPKAKFFTEKALAGSLVQFVGDGAFSVGYLIASVMKDLAHRPEVQLKIQGEVDEVVGRNRLPSFIDRSKMPFTNAAICETLRICSLIPAFPSMECTKETTVCGCRVPKGAVTLVNFWSALHDPDVFEEPDKYDPTRFLPSEGKKSRSEWPITFGVGKRSCIGESLVNMETFLFVTSVLQSFDISPPEEDKFRKKEDGLDFNILLRAIARAS